MKALIALTTSLLFITISAFAQFGQRADSVVQSHYQKGAPGVAVAVVQNGEMVYQRNLGMASLEHNIAISDSSSFHIASVSKQFTAYLAILLEQEGKLDLERDIKLYLPELKHLEHKITLAQLANHTHGLPNISELTNLKGFGESDRLWHQDVVDMALRIETFNFEPGTQFEYNNTGFVLLAEIVARVSKMPFQEALQYYIFEPLAMHNSAAIGSPNTLVKNKVESYQLRQNGYVKYDVNTMTNGSSGIRTTIVDMAKWAAHFQKTFGNLDSPFTKMVQETKLQNGEVSHYGLGLETRMHKGDMAIFHGGGTAAYRAYTLHIPAHNVSVVILGNTKDYWPLAIAYKLADIYAGKIDIGLAKLPQDKSYTANLHNFEGTYEFWPGQYYCFTAEQDTLYLSFLGQPDKIALTRLANNAFAFPFYPESKFVFENNRMDFCIADFVYKCERIEIKLSEYKTEELENFVGLYRNTALNTTYEIAIKDGQLVAKHPINFDIPLLGLQNDSFFTPISFFGKIEFEIDTNNKISGFKLSAQNLEGLEFIRASN